MFVICVSIFRMTPPRALNLLLSVSNQWYPDNIICIEFGLRKAQISSSVA